MKRLNWIFAALLCVMAAPSFAQGVTGNVNLLLGQKNLDSGDWNSPFDEQDEFGILFDVSGDYWPVSLAVDLLGSSQQVNYWDGYRLVSTSELDIGVRKVFNIYGTTLYPYVGGGLALVSATFEDYYDYYGSYITDDSSAGIWLNGGIYWSIMNQFNIGVEARYSEADVTLYDFDSGLYRTVNAGGTHGGITFGVHW